MGSLRSKFNHKGLVVNGITLGDPPILTDEMTQAGAGTSLNDCWFYWDDSRIPSGVLDENGTLIPDADLV